MRYDGRGALYPAARHPPPRVTVRGSSCGTAVIIGCETDVCVA